MKANAFNIEKMESHEKVEFVYVHDYNDISVIFEQNHIKPELINHIINNSSETLHIYDICASSVVDKVRVSFEF